jgi:hypothetical protein
MSPTAAPAPSGAPLDAPFRPRRGRAVPLGFGAAAIVVWGVVGWAIASSTGEFLSVAAIGVLIAALMLRYATIRAVPRPEGLFVRNLFLSRTVPWGEILGVRFPEGDPWAHLDLAEGDTLAVMAIQRADAQSGRDQAQRLASLVAQRQAA